MKRYIPKIGCHVTTVRKKAFLLLGDRGQAAIIVDHDCDRRIFLKSRLNAETSGQECAITADHHRMRLWMIQLGGKRKGHSHPQHAESARMQDASQFPALPPGYIDGNLGPEVCVTAIDHEPVLFVHGALNLKRELQRMRPLPRRRILCHLGDGLLDPFAPPPVLLFLPV